MQGKADLKITGAISTSAVYVGQPITYTYTITNTGPDTAHSAAGR